jgi:hypothetical protein
VPELFLHGRKLKTIFDLLGDKENDITFSIGWAFAKCERFLSLTLSYLFPDEEPGEIYSINLQRSSEDGGYTDIEISTHNFHVIVEAKRGWALPSTGQLERYTPRLAGGQQAVIAVMAELLACLCQRKITSSSCWH